MLIMYICALMTILFNYFARSIVFFFLAQKLI